MSSSPQTIVGGVIAVTLALGIILLVVARGTAARAGRLRWPLVAACAVALVTVVVCFVGYGTARYELRVVLADRLHEQVPDKEELLSATEAALDVALTDEVLGQAARQLGKRAPSAAAVRARIQRRFINRGVLDPEGRPLRRPREGANALMLEYDDEALSRLVDLGGDAHAEAHDVVEHLAHELDELVILELYRRATDDEARRKALLLLAMRPASFPAWTDRELSRFASSASPELAALVAETRERVGPGHPTPEPHDDRRPR
jgi:hypothetical protein